MRLRGRRDVHDVGARLIEQAVVIVVDRGNLEPRGSLLREVTMAVTHRDDPCAAQPGNLLQVRIGDLAAADQRDAERPLRAGDCTVVWPRLARHSSYNCS